MLPLTPNLDLAEHGKLDPIVPFAKSTDFGIGPRLLGSEIVGWKSQNTEPLISILLVECLESVILRRVAASTRRVHDKKNLASVIS
jgi:hypothetical protein